MLYLGLVPVVLEPFAGFVHFFLRFYRVRFAFNGDRRFNKVSISLHNAILLLSAKKIYGFSCKFFVDMVE